MLGKRFSSNKCQALILCLAARLGPGYGPAIERCIRSPFMKRFFLGVAVAAGLILASSQAWSADKLLNASYDVGRELFAQVNKAFIAKHPGVSIDQSHAGTSAQARAIAEGL